MPVHGEPDAIPRSGVGLSLLAVAGATNGSAQHLERAAVVAQRLAGGGRVARPQQVPLPQAYRVHTERLGDALHVHFHGELRLRRAEPAKRAVGRRVGEHRPRRDPGVVAPVRTGRVDRPARKDHGTERDVGAAVEDDLDVHRDESPVARDTGAVPHDRRMPLGRGHHVLHAIVDHLDRPARLEREQRRVGRDIDGYSSLPPNPPPVSVCTTRTCDTACTQDDGKRTMGVERALDRAVDRHPAIFRNGDHALWLDVDVLLMPGAVRPFDDVVGGREAGLDVAFLDEDRLERGGRPLGIEDRLTGLFVELDGCAEQSLAVFVREQQHRLRGVANVALDQTRLVVGDQRDDVLTGDVAVVHHGEAGGIEVEMDAVQVPHGTDVRIVRPWSIPGNRRSSA